MRLGWGDHHIIRSSDPVDPVDPIDPVDPVDPIDPIDPIDPMDPIHPKRLGEPVDGSQGTWFAWVSRN